MQLVPTLILNIMRIMTAMQDSWKEHKESYAVSLSELWDFTLCMFIPSPLALAGFVR